MKFLQSEVAVLLVSFFRYYVSRFRNNSSSMYARTCVKSVVCSLGWTPRLCQVRSKYVGTVRTKSTLKYRSSTYVATVAVAWVEYIEVRRYVGAVAIPCVEYMEVLHIAVRT